MAKRDGPLARVYVRRGPASKLAVRRFEGRASGCTVTGMASFHEVMNSRRGPLLRPLAELVSRRALRRERAARQTALARLEAGRCYVCGATLEDALARLGSTRCHDCRSVGAPTPARAET